VNRPYLHASALAVSILTAAPAARAATCSVANRTLTVQAIAEVVRVRGGAAITVNGVICAQFGDVERISIVGADDTNERVYLYLQGFKPPGALAWSVALGTGFDRFQITAGSAGSVIAAGLLPDGTRAVDVDGDQEVDIATTGADLWQLDGGAGPDRLSGRLKLPDGVFQFDADLRMYGGAGNDVLIGGTGYDRLYGEDGADEIYGGTGGAVDLLDGGIGDDYLSGMGGGDLLDPGPGNDTALGGGGDDWFEAETLTDGDDLLDGGPGVDRVIYLLRSTDMTVDLPGQSVTTETETDTVIAVEEATTGGGNDTLIGTDVANYLSGDTGNDTLIGGGGIDILDCGGGTDSWSDAADTAVACEIPL
jgi:Ca2+-binding RTX toxin-like protein